MNQKLDFKETVLHVEGNSYFLRMKKFIMCKMFTCDKHLRAHSNTSVGAIALKSHIRLTSVKWMFLYKLKWLCSPDRRVQVSPVNDL